MINSPNSASVIWKIPTKNLPSQPHWQQVMKTAIRSVRVLAEQLNLPEDIVKKAEKATHLFPLFVPSPFLARMEKGNLNDPLLRQVLPVIDETKLTVDFFTDPLGEKQANPVRGLLHKYKGRLLVFPGTTCGINCRFCFRRHFAYDENRASRKQWQDIFSYIEEDKDIAEVILSGGDPLAVNDQRLLWIVKQIAEIKHVSRLRIHSRLPIVIPSRINTTLLQWIKDIRLKVVMVVHCNHANEIDAEVSQALLQLKKAGVTLLNQSVLLKNINDSVDALHDLSLSLFDNDVIPYYLHLPDKVQGTAHFDVDEQYARKLMGQLSRICSGYMVPRLVREVAGKGSKTILSPLY
ncbi:MAG: EF-P beta-lysylation protein EpmB [Endozoicomonadaceae bacterium]|nr:EF-P beta-lysylation protein EpmB [Endozoicomonadaceae bacterium]